MNNNAIFIIAYKTLMTVARIVSITTPNITLIVLIVLAATTNINAIAIATLAFVALVATSPRPP